MSAHDNVVGLCTSQHHRLGKDRRTRRVDSSRTVNLQPSRKLTDEGAAAELVVPVTDGIQNRFTHGTLAECRNRRDEQAFLEVLFVISQIDSRPKLVTICVAVASTICSCPTRTPPSWTL